MANKQVILIAHGSRDPQWKNQFVAIEQAIQQLANHSRPITCFMELAEPTLEQVVTSALQQGQSQFIVIPLFFAEGKHLNIDIPAQINALIQKYKVNIQLTKAVGLESLFQQSIATLADHYSQSTE